MPTQPIDYVHLPPEQLAFSSVPLAICETVSPLFGAIQSPINDISVARALWPEQAAVSSVPPNQPADQSAIIPAAQAVSRPFGAYSIRSMTFIFVTQTIRFLFSAHSCLPNSERSFWCVQSVDLYTISAMGRTVSLSL